MKRCNEFILAQLEELKKTKSNTVNSTVAANALDIDVQTYRLSARHNPETLPIPVILIGNRVKASRIALIKYLERQLYIEGGVAA